MENIFELHAAGPLTPSGRNLALSDSLHQAGIVPERDVIWESDHGYMQTCIRGIYNKLGRLQDSLSRPTPAPIREVPRSPGKLLSRESDGRNHELVYGAVDGPIASIALADGDGSSRIQFVVASPEDVTLHPQGGSFLEWYRRELTLGNTFMWVELAFNDLHQPYDIFHKTGSIENLAYTGRVIHGQEGAQLNAHRQVMWREQPYRNPDNPGDNVRNFNRELRDRYAIAESCHWLGSAVSSLLTSTYPAPRTFK